MKHFLVSARKYRPLSFGDVVGQHAVTTTLGNAIANKQMAQAYLFCGPRGVGKTTCARIFAREINTEPDAVKEPDYAFNIFELDAASNNTVEDIRSLIDQVRIPPQTGRYKVYIIDEAHMLSQAAFNTFLKTLEEPPEHAVFILATTEKHKILPTILSRCQIFDFNRISVSEIEGHLRQIAKKENIETEDEALNIIAIKADGALRDALSLFDQLVSYSESKLTYKTVIENLSILDYEYYFKTTSAILQHDTAGALLLLDDILKKGFDA
ncbi:MAG: DNA polymerase III subunit gamma/tau, partial [Flavobacteriales bacterium]